MAIRRVAALFLSIALLFSVAGALNPEQALELLEEYYIDPLPAAAYEAETIEAIIEALGDPYTYYFNQEEYDSFLGSMQDTELIGAGIQFFPEAEGLYVSRIFEGSAADGKLYVNDIILTIDGKETVKMEEEEAWDRLMGEQGTRVNLRVLREDGRTVTVSLVFKEFVFPMTDFAMLFDHIGYFQCMAFGPETYGHFSEAVIANEDSADLWLIDLRGNTGGEIQAAADAVGLFVQDSEQFFSRDNSGGYYAYESQSDYLTPDPGIVLVDGETASSSELFASAFRAGGAGIVIGTRTYGKGVGQILVDGEWEPEYFPEGGGMLITAIRNFDAASGSTPDSIGVVPDLLISEENTSFVALMLSEPEPNRLTSGYLRLDLAGWEWYIDLDILQVSDYLLAFGELLSALPPEAQLYRSAKGSEWAPATVEEVAAQNKVPYRANTFPDLAETPFDAEILTLLSKNMLSGNERGEFMPEGELTRAELCAMLVKAIGYPMPEAGEETGFADVSPTAWYAPYVSAMAKQGLVQGYDGKFDPEAVLNHEQFMVILARVIVRLNLFGYETLAEGMDAEATSSGNYDAYSDWARELVWLGDGLYYDDVVNIDPAAPTTRAEAACSLYLILVELGYLLP